ncbi:FdtA/QdtA family cupin domain-containing protein [Pedobacter aquatilis]|uniref:sugar 3,4-ketoisomerase n=1 Tax=Pedobacter aquatilis TaxID=351343 RepID=UPI0025B3F425|nr:FdtA/QdtA family cupin domain-containing protein [Pedobacter aquatilis]MDN3587290.1 FdtA/QdtA family cupin domain-containing protein [Pedobacter aquatilis]
MGLDLVKIIEFPKILDERGNLSFLEESSHVPFEIKRTYWIYDVPGGEERGGHSYFNNQEVIIALSGSFDVILNDGQLQTTYSLNRSYYGLYVPSGIWRQMNNFSTNSLAFIVASNDFDENDYERDLDKFKKNGKYI